jgi:hypothetical protein
MKKLLFASIILAFIFYSCSAPENKEEKKNRLAKALRENKNGWIYVHLEGSPSDVGYQHGY